MTQSPVTQADAPAGSFRSPDQTAYYLATSDAPRLRLMSSVRTILIAATAACIISGILVAFLHYKPSLSALMQSAARTPPVAQDEWITNAMKECDAEASKDADSLYFLVIPIAPASKDTNLPNYQAPIRIGKNVLVVTSQELLDGLKDGSLTFYRKPFTFAIQEQASGTAYKWTSTGASRLAARQAASVVRFKVGLKLPAWKDVEWSGETDQFPVKNETGERMCFWVNALVRE